MRSQSRALRQKAKGHQRSKQPGTAPVVKDLYRETDWTRAKEPPIRPGVGAEPYRQPARRDYARVIHSAAFRRLQGKTQLFPGNESDFFRNRLTHSLEVAQVAKAIAFRANALNENFRDDQINADIVEIAGLVHDIGHPPFGHNGEKALDDCMKPYGGFEGNAQTLRILTRLEKKETERDTEFLVDGEGRDTRLGLNLCFRVLASALKYDNEIPPVRGLSDSLEKGYYACDAEIVRKIKQNVEPNAKSGEFKTIECSIMDIADDIAYSTYDLEDSLKAGFLSPLAILTSEPALLNRVAKKVNAKLKLSLTADDALETLREIFLSVFQPDSRLSQIDLSRPEHIAMLVTRYYGVSRELGEVGYSRTLFTSELISKFLSGVRVEFRADAPALSKATLESDTARRVEVLKTFTYEATIMSSRLKISEYRGYNIVSSIFRSLSEDRGSFLLPADCKQIFDSVRHTDEKMRVISDFIAGMTDRYALEFYGRLHSESPQTIFKPI